MMVYSAKDFADALDRIDTRVADFTSFFAASIQPTLKSEAQRTLDRLVAAKNFKKRLEDF